MGIAAYNRGSMVLRRRLDMEHEERSQKQSHKIRIHEYVDFRNGETVRVAYDDIGPLANQRAAITKAQQ
ncbi:MAG: hypothetical protein NUV75_02245 [Gallionella sp.]|nr:hypothetical protein [Gallionella sp.]